MAAVVELYAKISERFGIPSLAAAALCSFSICSFIYLSSGVLSRLVSRTYKTLDMKDQQRWNAGATRGCLGFILALHGVRAFLDGVPDDDLVYGRNSFLMHTCSFALGFFIFETRDSLTMFLAHNIMEETLLQHHLLGIVLFATALYWEAYSYLACVVLVQEFAAPFTHAGWILSKCGRTGHWLWECNQYMLIAVWLLFRTIVDLVIGYQIALSLLLPPFRFLDGPLFPLLFFLIGFLLLSTYLNPIWLQLKFRQLHRRNRHYARRRVDPSAPSAGSMTAAVASSLPASLAAFPAGADPLQASVGEPAHPHQD